MNIAESGVLDPAVCNSKLDPDTCQWTEMTPSGERFDLISRRKWPKVPKSEKSEGPGGNGRKSWGGPGGSESEIWQNSGQDGQKVVQNGQKVSLLG